ncbi:uncharacterized protein TA06590 [Theileria annulata]|uniref:Phytanoyl-CoA dioxygenase (PhyH) n=1 Tax=Theileria annulata TaxID=5874 RepID=Q4UIE7_THEAN|nr:uncharacterized protein TA06590 [Theileria annulata]CAI73142.1 hypothetical protein TA06590 [Theileria annulata]|eukprot:XP_953820.1 hypothetical protein TA06590 [Theileria annulata]
MAKHPSYSFSLDSKTLFSTSEDEQNYDLMSEKLWKDRSFLKCVKSLSKYIVIPKSKLENLSRNLVPAELQIQALLEILSNQKLHYNNPLKYDKSSATRSCYLKSLGLDLTLELDQLIDESGTSFEHLKVPQYWTYMLPARYIEAKHNLDTDFKTLVSKSFKLLHKYWQKSGLISDDGDVTFEVEQKFNTIAKNTIGKNIGCVSTPYLPIGGYSILKRFGTLFKRPSPFTVNCDSGTYVCNNLPSFPFLFKVKQTLDKYGVAVVRNVFSKDQIREIKSKLHIKSTLKRTQMCQRLNIQEVGTICHIISLGRINCVIRGTSFNEYLSPIQSFWMPFVYYLMKRDSLYLLVFSNYEYINCIKWVWVDSMSYVEPWHRENKRSGINIVVPLQDTNKVNGRMQFLPGTHNEPSRLNPYTCGPVGVDLNEGDVLIYNSSVLHRNTINESNVCQSMVVFTYDHVDTPPPGQGNLLNDQYNLGVVKYFFDNYYGNAIVNLNYLCKNIKFK